MNLYDDVAMPLYIALLLWILPGIILTPLLFNYVPSQKLKGFSKALVLLAANIIAFGSIVLYGALALDFYSAPDGPVATGNFLIIDKGYTSRYLQGGGEKIPSASIIYKNQLKNFDFPSETMTILNHSKNIRLQTRPGFLGFEVIKSKQLVKQ